MKPHLATSSKFDPVFIVGIGPRSGTNYLQDLLVLHPDCVAGATIPEDFLLWGADVLLRYVQSVSSNWLPQWPVQRLEGGGRDLLCRCVGEGLKLFLTSQFQENISESVNERDKRRKLVTKTPSTRHLDHFFRFFPDSRLLLLVRDGRSVAESSAKTFHMPYERVARQWAEAAETILSFQRGNAEFSKQFMILRYEDLFAMPEQQMSRVLEFLGLDVAKYDFSAATNLPVRGSSSLQKNGIDPSSPHVAAGIHWSPVDRPVGFDPLNRWAYWGRARHERFNWIAGGFLEAFGYTKKRYKGQQFMWKAWNWTLDRLHPADIIWPIKRVFLRLRTVSSLRDLLELGKRKLKALGPKRSLQDW